MGGRKGKSQGAKRGTKGAKGVEAERRIRASLTHWIIPSNNMHEMTPEEQFLGLNSRERLDRLRRPDGQ